MPGSADSLIRMVCGSARKNGGLSLASAMLISTSTLVDLGSPEKTCKCNDIKRTFWGQNVSVTTLLNTAFKLFTVANLRYQLS